MVDETDAAPAPAGGGRFARPLRLFAIRPGEGRRAALAFLYLFLIITSYLLIKSTRNALFISAYGAMKLPYVMLGVAVLAGAFAAVYIPLARRFATRRLVAGTLVFFASNVLLFWWLAAQDRTWLYPILYLWTGVFGVIAPTQVWTVANELFTTREAKRLFGFIGAGGILGGFSGGALANQLAPVIGTDQLLLIVAGLLVAAAFVVSGMSGSPAPAHDVPAPRNLRQSLGVIGRSAHLRLLAVLVFVSALTTTSIDFQFSIVAEKHIQDPDRLAAFFGGVYATVALLSFLLQILTTSRLLAWYGVGAMILMLPAALTAGTVWLLVTQSLSAGVLLKGSDGALKHALDRSCRELLYLPVPASVKLHAKSTIDTVFDRLGDGTAGLLQIVITALLTLVATGPLAPETVLRGSLAVNLTLLVAWVAIAMRLKRAYVGQLLVSLGRPRRPPTELRVASDADARATIFGVLASGSERERLGALEWIAAEAIPIDEAVLVERIQADPAPAVRRAALALLLGREGAEFPAELLPELEGEGQAALVAAIDVVIEPAGTERERKLDALLDGVGDATRLSIVAWVLRRLGTEFAPLAERVFEALLDPAARPEARRAATRALALLPAESPLHDRLPGLLDDSDPSVAAAAAETAGRLGRLDLAPRLVSLLARPGVRTDARRGLVALDRDAIPSLERALGDVASPADVRRQIPRLLADLSAVRAAPLLAASVHDRDRGVAERSMAALHVLRQRFRDLEPIEAPALVRAVLEQADVHDNLIAIEHALTDGKADAALQWLLDSLAEERARSCRRMFDLLALRWPVREIQHSWLVLRDGSAAERANAIEYLDNVLPGPLRSRIVPLLEHHGDGRGPRRTRPLGSVEALRRLAAGEHPWLAACALYVARQSGVHGLEEAARAAATSTDPMLREEARAFTEGRT